MNALERHVWKQRFRNIKSATLRKTGKKPTKGEMGEAVGAMLKMTPRSKPKENWVKKGTEPMSIADILKI